MRFILLCILISLCSCSHRAVRIGKSVYEQVQSFSQQETTYHDVLQTIGPPWRMYSYQEGFLFVYASYDSDEKKFSLSYGQYGLRGKADYASGSYFEDLTALYFSKNGRLLMYGTKREQLRQGWGGSLGPVIIGADLFSNPFFEKYDYYNQQHVPFLSSFYQRANVRRGPPHRQYIEDVETTPQVDRSLEQGAKKRKIPALSKRKIIPLQLSVESLELSKFRWFEVKEESDKRPSSRLVPHVPRKQLSNQP